MKTICTIIKAVDYTLKQKKVITIVMILTEYEKKSS